MQRRNSFAKRLGLLLVIMYRAQSRTAQCMNFQSLIRRMRFLMEPKALRSALCVSFDAEHVWIRRRESKGRYDVRVRFAWASVRRVCFKDNGPMASDEMYVFISDRPRALTIPLEADGGGAFWRELRTRGVFPAELHEQATLSTDGRLYCWPPLGR
jgi:hypothetical protein